MRRVFLMALAVCLGACGALQKAEPPYTAQWEDGLGGVYTESCRHGETLWLVGHHQATSFSLKAASGPRVLKTQTLGQRVQNPSAAPGRCTEETYSWRGERGAAPQEPHSVAQPLLGKPHIHAVSDSQQFEVAQAGWSYVVDGQIETGRRQVSNLRDAVLKKDALWLLSVDGFWRLDLKKRHVIPIALPAALLKARPSSFFQDGRAFWITTEDGRAWPIEVKGNYAHPMAKPGKYTQAPTMTRQPVRGGTLEWSGRGSRLDFVNDEGRTQLSRSAVGALLPLHSSRSILGSKGRIEVLDFHGDGVTVVQSVRVPGHTVRLFVRGRSLIAVGPEYGILFGQLSVPSDKATLPKK